jgi:hypothetical protein
MTQHRICKYLRHPTDLFIIPARRPPHEAEEAVGDPLTVDLCAWLTETHKALPPVLQRRAGGLDLNDGDCDHCPCFAPVDVTVPTSPLVPRYPDDQMPLPLEDRS